MKLYGCLQNRMEENKMFCDEIKVGTGVTEFSWSDRHPYEVTKVIDQKHVYIRALDHKPAGEAYSNEWKLESNESHPEIKLVKRGEYWYIEKTATIADLESADPERRLWVCMNGFDAKKIREKGEQTKYFRGNYSFGFAEYHYDYEF